MMTALATVTSIEQSNGVQQVQVSCEQKTSCKSCKSQKSCGTGMVSKALGSKVHHWQIKTDTRLQEGQVVEIGLPEKASFYQH